MLASQVLVLLDLEMVQIYTLTCYGQQFARVLEYLVFVYCLRFAAPADPSWGPLSNGLDGWLDGF